MQAKIEKLATNDMKHGEASLSGLAVHLEGFTRGTLDQRSFLPLQRALDELYVLRSREQILIANNSWCH